MPQFQVAKMLEGHTIRRILPPIIDDLHKYHFAILGSSLRSLGVPVSLGLTRKKLAKRKGNKMNKKCVDARVFFSGLAVFKFGTKVVMLLMNTFCQNIT